MGYAHGYELSRESTNGRKEGSMVYGVLASPSRLSKEERELLRLAVQKKAAIMGEAGGQEASSSRLGQEARREMQLVCQDCSTEEAVGGG